MARLITESPADFCLENCPNMKIKVDPQIMYSDGEVVDMQNVIYCEHELICKMWHDYIKNSIVL